MLLKTLHVKILKNPEYCFEDKKFLLEFEKKVVYYEVFPEK